MSTTSTEYTWFWYIRKKDTRYYIGLVNEYGDAPTTGGYDLDIYYDEIPDDLDAQSDTFPIPVQFELGIIKGVAAELMAMSGKDVLDIRLRDEYKAEYEKTIKNAIQYQLEESQQPIIIRPFNLRD